MSMGVSSINNTSFDPAAMFKKLDVNADGSIDKEEFLANIKKQDVDTEEKLLKIFEETDTDGDGKISQAENEAVMKKMQLRRARLQAAQAPPPMIYAIRMKTVKSPSRRSWLTFSNNSKKTLKPNLLKANMTTQAK